MYAYICVLYDTYKGKRIDDGPEGPQRNSTEGVWVISFSLSVFFPLLDVRAKKKELVHQRTLLYSPSQYYTGHRREREREKKKQQQQQNNKQQTFRGWSE